MVKIWHQSKHNCTRLHENALTEPMFNTGGEMIDYWMGATPMGRPGEPEELGGIVVYLASDASSFAQGSVFTIDGGYTAL